MLSAIQLHAFVTEGGKKSPRWLHYNTDLLYTICSREEVSGTDFLIDFRCWAGKLNGRGPAIVTLMLAGYTRREIREKTGAHPSEITGVRKKVEIWIERYFDEAGE